MSYDGVDAEQISTAKVLFWNGGLQAVLGGDISQTNPIRIAAQGGASILGVTGMHVNNSDNGLDHHTSADGRSELITFQYLDRGQGAVFEIVHIGLSGNDIQVLGAGAGFTSVRHVVRQNTEPLGDRGASTIKQSPPSRRLTFTIGLLFLLSIEAIVGLAGVATIIAITRESPSFGSAFVFIVAACIGVITLYSFMRRRTPKGLELFDQ